MQPKRPAHAAGSDAAYQSLRSMLLSPLPNAEHLDAMDRNTLYGAIGHFLSAMAQPNVADFTSVLVNSPTLWLGAGDPNALADRTGAVVQAVMFAVSERIALIRDNVAKHRPSAAPRELRNWVEAIVEALPRAEERAHLPALTVLTGLLCGVHTARQKKPKLSLGLGALHTLLAREWTSVSAALLQALSTAQDSTHTRTAALVLVAHSADILDAAQLAQADDRLWVSTIFPALLAIFHGHALDHAFEQAYTSPDGIVVEASMPGVDWAARCEADSLFKRAGPLARVLSDALQRLGLAMEAEQFQAYLGEVACLTSLHTLATRLDTAWNSSVLAGAPADAIAPASREYSASFWRVFKTLLFATTMLLDAVVSAVAEMCPSPVATYPPGDATYGVWPPMPRSNIPLPYLRLLSDALHIYMPLYFCTATFGLDGFESYRKVFYSALDVLGHDAESCTQLTAALAFDILHGARPDATLARSVGHGERMHTTYLLLIAEQLAAELPQTMVDRLVLPMAQPYLEDTRFQDTFESAHAFVLALYKIQSPCTAELTPFYVDLVLASYPSLLTDTQLEAALTTVVASLSERSDSLAWWCIERLDIAMVRTRITDPVRSLAFARCIAALLPSVNLVLLRALLAKLSAAILHADPASTERTEMLERTYASLGEVDASTQEEAMHWWLEHIAVFTHSMRS